MPADDRGRPGKLRAARQSAADILAVASREGRLNDEEYDTRTRAVRAARTAGQIDRLLADLPRQLGVRDWADHLRIRLADRQQADRWLGEAVTEGRITGLEQERRLVAIAAAGTYADLKSLVDGVPGPPQATRDDLLVSTADRQSALDRLDRLLADGLLTADEHEDRQASVRTAERYRDLDRAVSEGPPESTPAPARPAEAASPAARPAADRSGRFILVAAVVVAVAASVGLIVHYAGDESAEEAAGRDPKVLWSAPFDRPSDAYGVGNWFTDGTVVRARNDKVVGYAVADGRVSWTLPIPTGDVVCTMSRTVAGNVGLIGHAAKDEGHCTNLVAVDIDTGLPLWQRRRPVPEENSDIGADEVAVAGEIAVIKEPAGFVAVNLSDNKQRWRLAVGKGCLAYSVTAAADTAALVTTCAKNVARLLVVDTATGRERWRAQFRTGEDDYGLKRTSVLSLDPVVIRTGDDEGRGGALIRFDDRGRRQATIPQSQQDIDVAPEFEASRAYEARPDYSVGVLGDTLIAAATQAGDNLPGHVVAFSLVDGRRLWLTEVEEGNYLSSVDIVDGKVLVTTDMSFRPELRLLSMRDGQIQRTTTLSDVDGEIGGISSAVDVGTAGDRYIIVNSDGAANPPVVGLG